MESNMESTIEKSRSEGRLHVLYGHLTEGYKNVKVPYVSAHLSTLSSP